MTIILLLTIIGSGSIVVSLIYETNTTQYIPTQPTQLYDRDNTSSVNVKKSKELDKDIANKNFFDDYFIDDELEIAEELKIE